MTLYDIFLIVGAALGIIQAIPKTFTALKWIALRTKTKKDDELISKVERVK